MNLLAFDTATESITVGISYRGRVCETTCSTGLKHAGNLLPLVENLLSLHGVPKEELDGIVCTSGPGSFTGLRIGMATGKGLAMGLAIPIISVPTLDVYAHCYSFTDLPVLTVIDAKKRRVYGALYRKGTRLTPFLDESPENIVELVLKELGTGLQPGNIKTGDTKNPVSDAPFRATVIVTGPGASLFLPFRDSFPSSIDNGRLKGLGLALLSLGEEEFGKSDGDPKNTGPLYLRKSEAELDMERGVR